VHQLRTSLSVVRNNGGNDIRRYLPFRWVSTPCIDYVRMHHCVRSFVSWPGKVPDALGASGLAWGVYDLFDSLGCCPSWFTYISSIDEL
jgi:hypothetical protein